MYPSVSVIIPYYNDKTVILRSLKYLAAQSYPLGLLEVIIVDDYSELPLSEIINENYGLDIKIVRHKENKGSAASRNTGIKHAENELLVFIDSDVLADEKFITAHVKRFNKTDKIVRFGTIRWHPDVKNNHFTKYGRWFEYDNVLDKPNLDFNDFNGANFSVSRSALIDSGVLFDESFTKYGMEDIEFGYLLKKKKFRFEFCPDALVWHYRQATLENQIIRAKNSAYSIQKFISKHHDKNILEKLRFLNRDIFVRYEKILSGAERLSDFFLAQLDLKYNLSFIEQEMSAMCGIFLIEYAPWSELYHKKIKMPVYTQNYQPQLVNSAVDYGIRINLLDSFFKLNANPCALYGQFILPEKNMGLRISLCYETGRYFFIENKLDQAQWILEKALETGHLDIPQIYLIHYLLASICKRKGYMDSAKKYFGFVADKAVNRIHASQYASACYHLGDICFNEGNKHSEAKFFFEKALSICPLHKAAGEAVLKC
ncbi:glycosyltransferase [bacterium]|nr:glycosyltransferase [bacterium]